MADDLPTGYAQFSEYLSYDPETGDIRWIKRPGRRGAIGEIAGNIDRKGYRRISFKGRSYQGHRVAFILFLGEWPKGEIDHINGQRSDNRWRNLREASRSVNGQNIHGPMAHNTSGFLSVYFHRKNRRWAAQIKVNKKSIHLGQFSTAKEAHACYVEAKRRLHVGCTI